MNRLYIENLKENIDKEIIIKGFVDKVRDMQYVQFVILRDKTGKVQITIEKNEENKSINDIVSTITSESCIKVIGVPTINEAVKLGGIEILPSNVEILSLSNKDLPYVYKDPNSANRETRLDYRFLDLRLDKNRTLFEISTLIDLKFREYFTNNDYVNIISPKIVGESSEGGSEVFKLKYFDNDAYLAQSPQLYKQMGIASGLDKVFDIGTVFRAENSHTSYHAAEIYMVDMEMSFIDSHSDVMDELEAMIKYAFTSVKEKYSEEIKTLFKSDINVDNPFLRLSFAEAKDILKNEMRYVAEDAFDFERKEEELICKYAKDKYKTDFVFVDKYPYSARPFYTMKDENDDTLTKSFDLLYKGVEITSGAQREHRYDVLKSQIEEKGINSDSMKTYLDFFNYGMPPHGGFGFGFHRLIMKLLNYDNIREVTYIYRGVTRLYP